MKSNQEITSESTASLPFENLKAYMDVLINDESFPLMGNESPEAGCIPTGERRELDFLEGNIAIARYTKDESNQMEAILTESGIDAVRPYGHIEMSIIKSEAAFDTVLYLMDNGKVYGMTHCSVADQDAKLLDDSRQCYDFAWAIGLQSLWIDMLYSEDRVMRSVIELEDSEVEATMKLLRYAAENPSG